MISVNRIISRCLGMGRRVAAIVLVVLAAVSCSDDRAGDCDSANPREGYITIELSSSSLRTRADESGVDGLNENLIERALVCLMPTAAAGDDDTPVFLQTVNFSSNTQSTATVQLRLSREMVNAIFPDGTKKATAYVIANLPNTSAYTDAALRGKTLGELHALSISSNFASSANQPSFVMDGTSSEITLEVNPDDIAKSTVTGNVPLVRAAAKITLGVKITTDQVTDDAGRVWTPVAGSMSVLISNGVKTSSVTPSVHTLVSDDYYNTSVDAVVAAERGRGFVYNADNEFPYTQSRSFYTYPNKWGGDDETMTSMTLVVRWRSGTTYRTCYYMVPVLSKTNVEGIVRNVSYHVNVNIGILGSTNPDNPFELLDVSYKAVDWGKEDVKVSIDDFRYLVMDKTDYVVNNEAVVDIPFYSSHETTITNTKVTYYLYNFSAEGNEEAVEITEQQNERSTTTLNGSDMTHIYASSVDNMVNSTTGMRTLTFNHPLYQWTPYERGVVGGDGTEVVLGPDASGTYPTETLTALLNKIYRYRRTENLSFCRYDIEITLVHTDKIDTADEELYTKKIRITQYPGMYVTSDHNDGATYGVRVRTVGQSNYTGTYNNVSRNFGYAFVNALTYDDSGTNPVTYWSCNSYGSLLGLDYETNNGNPNMYVITISQLDTSSDFVIGDPRSTIIDNLNNEDSPSSDDAVWRTTTSVTLCHSAKDMSGNTRTLRYYYPTLEDESTKMMVAPKIRIASSFGEMQSVLSKFYCKRRCATYQEREFPAGRWRVPTYGEMKYIVQLSLAGKIPPLFNSVKEGEDGGRYLTAHGIYQVNATTGELKKYTGSSTTAFVRPVYDEWYWKDTLPFNESAAVGLQYVYTFGDRER